MGQRQRLEDPPSIPDPVLQFIREMPKAEIHVHLEGTVRPTTLLALATRHGIPLPARDGAALADWFRFRDFPHFIEIYMAVCECLRDPADFALVVEELGEAAAAQNIRYLEVHFNPEPHVRKRGHTFAGLLAGMNRGRAAALARWGVEIRWIADGVRDAESGPASVSRTVAWIAALPPAAGVVALGLGGDEVGHPPSQFTADFAAAGAAGLHLVAHAGETTGPETIWATLRDLGAERIGHGLSALADPALVAHLAEAGTPLELCPTSNLRTGLVATAADHPFRRLDEAGVLVTVNSDDPALFGATLTDEYELLARTWAYGPADLERIAANALRASFLPDPDKTRLLASFAAETASLRHRLGLP
jgi:aminodeoxyfutalosine deaminase